MKQLVPKKKTVECHYLGKISDKGCSNRGSGGVGERGSGEWGVTSHKICERGKIKVEVGHYNTENVSTMAKTTYKSYTNALI